MRSYTEELRLKLMQLATIYRKLMLLCLLIITTVFANSDDVVPTLIKLPNVFIHTQLALNTVSKNKVSKIPTIHFHPLPKFIQQVPKITKTPLISAYKQPQIQHPQVLPSRLWNLRDVDIRAIIEEVSKETGKNFIVDPRVQGKISIISSKPIDADEVYQMFLSALSVLGYSAIPSGPSIKIVPSMQAQQLSPPLATKFTPGKGDEVVVRVIPVNNVSAMQLVPLLRSMLPEWGNLAAYAPSNILIAAGTASSIARISGIVQRADTASTDGIEIIPLRFADAKDLVTTLQQVQGKNTDQSPQISLAADTQSNAILLNGTKSQRIKMRILISELDVPSRNAPNGNTKVIYLQYLRADDLVPILAGIAQSYGYSAGTVIGTISQQQAYKSTEGPLYGGGTMAGQENLGAAAPAVPQSTVQASTSTTSSSGGDDTRDNRRKVEIIGEANTNSIIINAPPPLISVLRQVIAKLDVRPNQVLIEALIAEVDQNASLRLGIQWGTLLASGTNAATSTITGAAGAAINPISSLTQGIGIITKNGFDKNIAAIITALEQDQSADILSTPSVTVLDNHQAQIFIGTQRSITSTSYPGNSNGAGTTNPFQTFQQENIGLHLNVTPTINKDNTIQLQIDQGDGEAQNPEDTSTTPILNISKISTSVLVNNGHIIVLGGLIKNQIARNNDKIPILGDLPLIGHIFNNYGHEQDKKVLMIFIRPIIIRGRENGHHLTGKKYNYVRNEQLDWMRREQHYYPDESEHVLPRWNGPTHLPHPFGANYYYHHESCNPNC